MERKRSRLSSLYIKTREINKGAPEGILRDKEFNTALPPLSTGGEKSHPSPPSREIPSEKIKVRNTGGNTRHYTFKRQFVTSLNQTHFWIFLPSFHIYHTYKESTWMQRILLQNNWL